MLNVQRIAWPLIVVLAFSAGAVWHVATAQEAKKPVTQWEYTYGDATSKKSLDEHGKSGWELVAVAHNREGAGVIGYFKRQK